jgi:hypothetical protein
MMRSAALGLLLLAAPLFAAAPAAAQVDLTITNGRVWLAATNATVGQILEEWSRIGGTEFVNGDRVPGGPVTLQLEDVSEQEALDVLLRSAAGFMAVRKPAAVAVAANSGFDRIFILPTTTIVPSVGSAATSPTPEPVMQPPVFTQSEPPVVMGPNGPMFAPGVQPVLGPDGLPVLDDQQDAPVPQQQPRPLPPGFSPTDPYAPPPPPPPPPDAPGVSPQNPTATTPVGVPRPGMIVPPQQPATPDERNPTPR